jgi:hypothetical protein
MEADDSIEDIHVEINSPSLIPGYGNPKISNCVIIVEEMQKFAFSPQ